MERKKKKTMSRRWFIVKVLCTLIPAIIITVLLIKFGTMDLLPGLEDNEGEGPKTNKNEIRNDTFTGDPDPTLNYVMENNMFKTMMTRFAEIYNLTDCYVCAQFPTSATDIMRYMSVAVSQPVSCRVYRTLLKGASSVCTPGNKTNADKKFIKQYSMTPRSRQISTNSERPTHYLLLDIKRKGELCLRIQEPKFTVNLKSRIKRWDYFADGETSDVANEIPSGREKQENKISQSRLDQIRKQLGDIEWIEPNLKTPTINMGSSECFQYIELKGSDYLNGYRGMYFVCGKEAYFYLPEGWFGSCYLAFVFPQMIHIPRIPQQSARTKRSSDSNGFLDFLGVIIPPAGVARNAKRLNRLAQLVEDLADEDASALGNITEEMTAIRAVVIQNRMVLDIMLAKENGVCGVLHAKCCMYIPDNSINIKKSINHIHKVAKDAHDMSTGLWASLEAWFGSWEVSIVKYLLIAVAVLLGLCTCVQILPICISKICRIPKIAKARVRRSEERQLRKRVYNPPEDIPDQRHPLENESVALQTLSHEPNSRIAVEWTSEI